MFWSRARCPCTKTTICHAETMKDSSKEVNLGNNSTRSRFKCDIFGTDKGEIEGTSLFLHNLSSILYTGGRGDLPGCQVRTVRRLPSRRASDGAHCASCASDMRCSSGGARRASCARRRASGCAVRRVLCCCVARGFCKSTENFFKKVLDRNRRSVSIVDAPFTGN